MGIGLNELGMKLCLRVGVLRAALTSLAPSGSGPAVVEHTLH